LGGCLDRKTRVRFLRIKVVLAFVYMDNVSHLRTSLFFFIKKLGYPLLVCRTIGSDNTILRYKVFFDNSYGTKLGNVRGNVITNLGPTHLLYKTNSGLQAHSHMWPSRPASLSKSVKPQNFPPKKKKLNPRTKSQKKS